MALGNQRADSSEPIYGVVIDKLFFPVSRGAVFGQRAPFLELLASAVSPVATVGLHL